jgi:serine/threonine protein kinase
LIKDDDGVCISDPGFNSLMRQLKYSTHAPIPATWCYKPPEELLSDTPMGPEADVYAWASIVYEVGTADQHDHLLFTHYMQVFSGKRPYSAYHQTGGIIRIINDGHRTLDKPLEIGPKLWRIMQQCWKINPADRPTMPQVESELYELD